MANFRGLLHHKPVRIFFAALRWFLANFHHHAPKNEAFEDCNHFIISGGSKVPEVANLRAQRGHLGVIGCVNRVLANNTSLET